MSSSSSSSVELPSEHFDFPKNELKILEFWKDIDAFNTSLKQSEGRPEYTFYDGPPFATGVPHYGHLLAGTIKDTITRYFHQQGFHVSRRFGWDCHGLPIEFEIDKQENIRTRDQVLQLGIPKYNELCRSIVMKYSHEWETVVNRIGRWIDMENDFKTMDPKFMESVWWVFKSLHEKGHVYRGFKVMPYSTGCATPLSNFEASMNYKTVPDPEVYVLFPLVADPAVNLVAWTTTPWTLPSNLALCVNPDMDYVKIRDKASSKIFVLAECRLTEGFYNKSKKGDVPFEVLEKFKGSTLEGQRYDPLFPYFESYREKGAFRVCVDSYVTSASGTGIVHQAPAFGEDDYRVCLKNEIISRKDPVPCPLDFNAHFVAPVSDFLGKYIKDADKEIIQNLKGRGRLFKSGTINHSYPFCWRSETPLIYRVVPSWFIAVENIREKLVKNNATTYWVPAFVSEGRFQNWLLEARDWAVSRNRFWGTPLPIWASDDFEEIVVVGSIDELEQLSGVRVADLHRHFVDDITIPSKQGKGVLKRVDEVFDCWFESGSMPYAQVHYPFENKEHFEANFPADFIAEGIDQTRGWFYTLLVISTLLFDKAPFKNVIVNGLVLASDGKKMSKRLKNYPDTQVMFDGYGADALRTYLITSPAVRGDDLCFLEDGVKEIVKGVLIRFFNSFRFLLQSLIQNSSKSDGGSPFVPDAHLASSSSNLMDKWILSMTHSLILFVTNEMEKYRLNTVVPRLLSFIEQLSNWYIKLNRSRLRGKEGQQEFLAAANTLFQVILLLTQALAPFMPFFTEYVYQILRRYLPEDQERHASVHFCSYPKPDHALINKAMEDNIETMQAAINLARIARERRVVPLRTPIKGVTIKLNSLEILERLKATLDYIKEEINTADVTLTIDDADYIDYKASVNLKLAGKRLRDKKDVVTKTVAAFTRQDLQQLDEKGTIDIDGFSLSKDELLIVKTYKGDTKNFEAAWDANVLVIIDLTVDQALLEKGCARSAKNRIQRLKKTSGIRVGDAVTIFYKASPEKSLLSDSLEKFRDVLSTEIGNPLVPFSVLPEGKSQVAHETSNVESDSLELWIVKD